MRVFRLGEKVFFFQLNRYSVRENPVSAYELTRLILSEFDLYQFQSELLFHWLVLLLD